MNINTNHNFNHPSHQLQKETPILNLDLSTPYRTNMHIGNITPIRMSNNIKTPMMMNKDDNSEKKGEVPQFKIRLKEITNQYQTPSGQKDIQIESIHKDSLNQSRGNDNNIDRKNRSPNKLDKENVKKPPQVLLDYSNFSPNSANKLSTKIVSSNKSDSFDSSNKTKINFNSTCGANPISKTIMTPDILANKSYSFTKPPSGSTSSKSRNVLYERIIEKILQKDLDSGLGGSTSTTACNLSGLDLKKTSNQKGKLGNSTIQNSKNEFHNNCFSFSQEKENQEACLDDIESNSICKINTKSQESHEFKPSNQSKQSGNLEIHLSQQHPHQYQHNKDTITTTTNFPNESTLLNANTSFNDTKLFGTPQKPSSVSPSRNRVSRYNSNIQQLSLPQPSSINVRSTSLTAKQANTGSPLLPKKNLLTDLNMVTFEDFETGTRSSLTCIQSALNNKLQEKENLKNYIENLKNSIRQEKENWYEVQKHSSVLKNYSYNLSLNNQFLDQNSLSASDSLQKERAEVEKLQNDIDGYKIKMKDIFSKGHQEHDSIEALKKKILNLKDGIIEQGKVRDLMKDNTTNTRKMLQKMQLIHEETEKEKKHILKNVEFQLKNICIQQ